MSINSPNVRLREFLKHKSVSGTGLAEQLGTSQPTISAILSGRRNLSEGMIARIVRVFPELNISWLLTGDGEMLVQHLSETIVTQQPHKDSGLVLLLPVEAMAGPLSLFTESVRLKDCRKIKSPVDGADWAIQISGDSMEPELHNGMYLYIRKMSGSYIPWGNSVVIDTRDGVVVKKIFPGDNEDYIWAKSTNPEYPPFRIPVSDIIGIYRILGGSFIISTI